MQNGSDGRDRGLSAFESFPKSTVPAELEFYEELKSGRLRGRKVGRRTIITQDDAEDWLRRLPVIEAAR